MTTPVFGTDPGNEHATVTLNGVAVDPTTLLGYGTQWTVRDDGLVENLVSGDVLTDPAPSGLQTWVNGVNMQTIGVGTVAPQPRPPQVDANPDGSAIENPTVLTSPPVGASSPAPVAKVPAKVSVGQPAPHGQGILATIEYDAAHIEQKIVKDAKEGWTWIKAHI